MTIIMNQRTYLFALLAIIFISCTAPKSYFTNEVKKKLETDKIPLSKLQFYIDKNVELRRELSSGETTVSFGKVKFENGKYLHIIYLKKYTPGVCTKSGANSIDISFETGDHKNLTFTVEKNATSESIYKINADEWINQPGLGSIGKITYDKQTYYIQSGGFGARLMINKKVTDKSEVKTRVMSGRTVQ